MEKRAASKAEAVDHPPPPYTINQVQPKIKPRLIIHGGAGNATKKNLPPERYTSYRKFMLSRLSAAEEMLSGGADALHVASYVVSELEDDPLFNAGRGAVFNRKGAIELEASVMVSSGQRKRGCAVSLLKHVKNPVLLASAILRRGDEDLEKGAADDLSAQGHVHLSGEDAEELASQWGLELREDRYFWTKERWQEHRRGLHHQCQGDKPDEQEEEICAVLRGWNHPPTDQPYCFQSGWDGRQYLPQGTVGCVVLDQDGTLAVATSTGGINNKVPGRIGDTPTFGAGFWADEWRREEGCYPELTPRTTNEPLVSPEKSSFPNPLAIFASCSGDKASDSENTVVRNQIRPESQRKVAMSGTGNGDSFLRLSAVRTVAARTQFAADPTISLADSVTWMAGPNGELQKSAGDRWGRTGEGQGGIIGMELINGLSHVVFDFNCGGMFRAYFDDEGQAWFGIFKGDDKSYDHKAADQN